MTDKEREYMFDQAIALTEVLNRQCDGLMDMIDNIDNREIAANRVSSLEADGDYIFHEFSMRFNYIVIEPSEHRAMVFSMLRHIEQAVDMIDELAKSVVRYNISEVPDGFRSAVNGICGAVRKEMHLVNVLRVYDSSRRVSFIRAVNDFDAFKVEYSKMYGMLIFDLFSNDYDPVYIMKWKSVYDAVLKVFESFEVSADDCYRYVIF